MIKLLKIVFFLVLCCIVNSSFAQYREENEKVMLSYLGYNAFATDADSTLAMDVDSILLNCRFNQGVTTLGDIFCANQAIEIIMQKIEKEYKAISGSLHKSERILFSKSHDMWQIYFNGEDSFLDGVFNDNGRKYNHGREHSVVKAEWLFQIARQRLIALRAIGAQIGKL